jgi:LysM repeat protein
MFSGKSILSAISVLMLNSPCSLASRAWAGLSTHHEDWQVENSAEQRLDGQSIYYEEELVGSSLPSRDRIWVQTKESIALRDIARQLQVPSSTLASMNGVDPNYLFRQGEWLVIPAEQRQVVGLGSRLVRRTPPAILAPPPVPTKGVVRLGDTLFKIAQRYGTSMQDILRLNPGLDTANLVAETEIQLVQDAPAPRPRAVKGLRPSTSGGLSWPVAPQRLRFDQTLDELVLQGVVSPAELQRVRTGATAPSSSSELTGSGFGEGRAVLPLTPSLNRPSQERNSITPIAKPLSERETALLQQIRSGSSHLWRLYGKCKYDWSNWKKLDGDIRFTSADCGPSRQWTIGVSGSAGKDGINQPHPIMKRVLARTRWLPLYVQICKAIKV